MLRNERTGDCGFFNTDTHELFEANKLTQPRDWIYRSARVNYTFNSLGYRCPHEFDQFDLTQCVLMFGCSITLGVGLDNAQTIPHQLFKLINRPVINLGIAGASAMHLWALTTQLINQGASPYACIYLWPGVNRLALFQSNDYHEALGPWAPKMLGPWAEEHHAEVYFKMAKDSVSQQWSQRTRVRHWTWNEYAQTIGGNFAGVLPPVTDYARDLVHPGIDSALTWAQILSKGL